MTTLERQSEASRKVVVLKGGAGATFRVDKDRVVIGSVISADVRLSGEGVSPIHAVIEIGADQTQDVRTAHIYDLASESGLFINGKKVVTSELVVGDEITIGRSRFKFALESPAQVRESLPRERVRRSDQGSDLYTDANEDLKVLLLEDERKVRPIFDYRPSRRQALEVVQSFGETILNVEHFVRERQVTIGTRQKDDFGIPNWLSTPRFPLVKREGASFILNLDRAVMKGVLMREGKILPLEEIPGAQITLGQNEFAKVVMGDVSFYLSFTAAPPRLKPRRIFDSDPLFFRLYFGSLILSAFALYGLFQIKVPDKLEAEPVPQRIATILYQPQKPPPVPVPRETKAPEPVKVEPKPTPEPKKPEPPKPKPTPRKVDLDKAQPKPLKQIPKEMVEKPAAPKPQAKPAAKPQPARQQGQSQAKEGAGARAKGKEGSRGEPNKPAGKTPQTAAKRPSPQAGEGRGSGASQVPDHGNVDFLKSYGGKIENLLGNAGAQLGKGGSKLKGFGGFSTQGAGGLALSGDGKGGGGTAEGLGGLANHGRGGGRVGTGLGAAGSGSGIVGGVARVAIRSGGAEETVVMGAIDSDAINAALLAHRDEFRLCYEREINAEHPGATGNVVPIFTIGGSGRVTTAGISSSTLKNAAVEGCVMRVIKRIEFPTPRGGGEVTVTKIFAFNPLGK